MQEVYAESVESYLKEKQVVQAREMKKTVCVENYSRTKDAKNGKARFVRVRLADL